MEFIDCIVDTKFYARNMAIDSNCVAITFSVPIGANPCTVNGHQIAAGTSKEISMSFPYIDRTKYEFFFGSGGTGNELYVDRILPKNCN